MNNKISSLLLALTFAGLAVTTAGAHPIPPPHPHPGPHGGYHGGGHGYWGGPVFFPSVSFVIGGGDSDPGITLAGHIFRKTGDSTYLFTDGTRTFQVDSDEANLPVGTPIVINGQFDPNAEFDLAHWHLADQ